MLLEVNKVVIMMVFVIAMELSMMVLLLNKLVIMMVLVIEKYVFMMVPVSYTHLTLPTIYSV